MKKYQIEVKGLKLEIVQDNDGKFVTPDIVKEYEKVGSAVKPSFEPIIIARKPFKGSLVDNVIEYGVGGLNIDECRVETTDNLNGGAYSDNTEFLQNDVYGKYKKMKPEEYKQPIGRFPANTILTYDETDFDEVCGGFPDTKGNGNIRHNKNNGKGYNCYSNYGDCDTIGYNDSGSASRYFYNAKASKKDRDCDGTIKNIHPTCKPQTLMQYLVRLVTPKGGTILDPFMGSGSTGKAVMFENKQRQANYSFMGIEKEKEYCNIAEARIKWASNYKEKKEEEYQISFNDLNKED